MAEYFGLDIGSSVIKVVQLKGDSVIHAGLTQNPIGRIGVDFIPSEKYELVTCVKKLIESSGISCKKAVISIPEVSVYSKVMSFPVISSAELASAIKWQSVQDVPLPSDQIELSWVVVNKPKKNLGNEQMKVLVVATPRKIANSTVEFLNMAGIEPLRAENEAVSLYRLYTYRQNQDGVTLLGDLGANSLKLVVLDEGIIKNIYSVNLGGMALTRALAQEFGLSLLQAEQYKRAYGADQVQAEGRIYKGIEPVLNSIMDEFVKVVSGYNQSNPDRKVEKIIFFGGGVYLKGIVGLLSARTGVEVSVGNAFENIKASANLVPFSGIYGVATGVAIKDMNGN